MSSLLSDRIRPKILSEIVGQNHLLGSGGSLFSIGQQGSLPHSMILWGPPGSGKTTLAKILADQANISAYMASAVTTGIKEVREYLQKMKSDKSKVGLLFLDEVHRFNRAQQDIFLPYIEDGSVIFIGATTQNPAFSLNRALLSRTQVYRLNNLGIDDLIQLFERALSEELGFGKLKLSADLNALEHIAAEAGGDGRKGLNLLELVVNSVIMAGGNNIELEHVLITKGEKGVAFDRNGDHFYDQISALHKSIRGSNPDASLYWTHRMLSGGCDPIYLLRRLVRIASEDIGNADPRALSIAINAWESFERLGHPEGDLAISQAVIYLAVSPKSNAVYVADKKSRKTVEDYPSQAVPAHLCNKVTFLDKKLGRGVGYQYDHDSCDGFSVGQNYFPEEIGYELQEFYTPTDRGLEKKIADKLSYMKQLKQKRKAEKL